MRIRKRLFLCVILTLLMIAIVPAFSSNASSNKTKALKAYKKYLSSNTIMVLPKNTQLGNYPPPGYQGSKPSGIRFALAYLDKDNTPELFLVDSKMSNIFGVFSYIIGKVVRVGFSGMYQKPIAYYKGEEYYYSYGEPGYVGGTEDEESYTYYKLNSNNDFGIVLLHTHMTDHDFYYSWVQTELSRPLERITHDEFNSLHSCYSGGKAPTKLKFYTNTSINRRKYLK